MENIIQFKRKISVNGNSKTITIPQELQEYLNIDVGDEIVLTPQKGKHGLYVAIWKGSEEK